IEEEGGTLAMRRGGGNKEDRPCRVISLERHEREPTRLRVHPVEAIEALPKVRTLEALRRSPDGHLRHALPTDAAAIAARALRDVRGDGVAHDGRAPPAGRLDERRPIRDGAVDVVDHDRPTGGECLSDEPQLALLAAGPGPHPVTAPARLRR